MLGRWMQPDKEIKGANENSAFMSKDFVFLIGNDQRPFQAHSDIITQQSKPLDVLINGPMSEGKAGTAILEDVSEGTFERFCQFAYTGDYVTPLHEMIEISNNVGTHRSSFASAELSQMKPTIAVNEKAHPWDSTFDQRVPRPFEVVENDGWGIGGLTSKKVKKKKAHLWDTGEELPSTPQVLVSPQNIRQKLEALALLYHFDDVDSKSSCQVRENRSQTEDYTQVFVGHAQLYVFADQCDVLKLRKLALSKLHTTLSTFTLYEARRGDIVTLLRYVYNNEHTRDRGIGSDAGKIDDLRELVLTCASLESKSLVQCVDFIELVGEGGEFAQDYVQNLMDRLN